MARITLRLDDALYDRLLDRARGGDITPSAYIRELLLRDQGADPDGYHARFDDLHATAIQTLAIIACSIRKASPDCLEEGLADARRILRERGLLDPEHDQA